MPPHPISHFPKQQTLFWFAAKRCRGGQDVLRWSVVSLWVDPGLNDAVLAEDRLVQSCPRPQNSCYDRPVPNFAQTVPIHQRAFSLHALGQPHRGGVVLGRRLLARDWVDMGAEPKLN